jgi:hypothetical protein
MSFIVERYSFLVQSPKQKFVDDIGDLEFYLPFHFAPTFDELVEEPDALRGGDYQDEAGPRTGRQGGRHFQLQTAENVFQISSGTNFTNILHEAVSYKSFRQSFFVLEVLVKTFVAQENGANALIKCR